VAAMRLGTVDRAGNDAAMTRRRRVLLGTLALVAGVIATYATAWMAVAFAPIGKVRVKNWEATAQGWQHEELRWPWPISGPLERPTDLDETRCFGLRIREWYNFSNSIYVMDEADAALAVTNGLNPVVLRVYATQILVDPPCAFVRELRAGWPLTCVRWWRDLGDDQNEKRLFEVRGGWNPWSWPRLLRMPGLPVEHMLPLRPLWPQFIANVLIWALALAGVVSGFAWIVHGRRVKRRRRRGWCLACGYNLAGLAPHQACPECGTPRARPELSPPETRPGTIDAQGRRGPATPPQSPLD
jgi:hypothetical protein